MNHLTEGAVQTIERVRLTLGRFLAAGSGHVFDITTGAEVPTDAPDDDGANVQVVFNLGEHRGQFRHHLEAHGVAHVWSVDGDKQGGALFFQNQCFAMWYLVHK